MPGVTVQLHGTGGDQSQITDAGGHYSFASLAPGKYDVQVTAPDFTTEKRPAFDVNGAAVLDLQLMLETQSQATVSASIA